MAHRTARLNVFGRRLLATRTAAHGWSVAKADEAPKREPDDRP